MPLIINNSLTYYMLDKLIRNPTPVFPAVEQLSFFLLA